MKIIQTLLLVLILCSGSAIPSWALLPAEVLVIANRNVPEGVALAGYYMEKRAIPDANLLVLATTDQELCSRESYNQQIAQPVRDYLKGRAPGKNIRGFVTFFGVPLKVEPPELNVAEQAKLAQLQSQRTSLKHAIQAAAVDEIGTATSLQQQFDLLGKKIRKLRKENYGAAVDSELALVMKGDYALNAWQPNPFFVGYRHLQLENTQSEVLMGSRLDGPSAVIVKRMIDDSLSAERDGVQGRAYFDATGPPNIKQNLKGYALYDQSLHLAADLLKDRNLMPVVVNAERELFQAGDAPDAFLYSGWYSLSQYVDAFDWQRGAIGYHIASGECETLRAGAGQGWCKGLLEDGVAATIGPVAEPYVQAFPEPVIFFKYLTSTDDTLVEAFFHSQRYLSWQMILLGDPLYRPFNN